MPISIERLRVWIVVAAVLLLLAIAGFISYARYRVRQVGRDLPAKLGLEIQTSTNGFTVSRSKAGHTLFVLHAAKAIQYKGGGHLVLHDVSIVMYGKDGVEADRMAGSQFDYDQATGIARAEGTVDIEVTPPNAEAARPSVQMPGKPPGPIHEPPGPVHVPPGPVHVPPGPVHVPPGPVHVKTSGILFDQKKQLATTEQLLTFEDGDSSGTARGATYDGVNETLVLAHDVVFNTVLSKEGGPPVSVKAQSASFNHALRQLVLINSLTEYQHDHGAADESTVFFRQDGSAEHMTAHGHVHVVSDEGSDMKAGSAYAQLDEKSQLQSLRLESGVLLISHGERTQVARGLVNLQTIHADSDAGVMTFSSNQLTHLQLSRAVSVVDQQIGLPADPNGSETRELRAARLDVDFVTDPRGKPEAKSALAKGDASVTVHTIHAAAPQQSTTLKGDQLFATLQGGHQLFSLRGNGNTYLLQNGPGDVSQTSRGDSLNVSFATLAGGGAARPAKSPASSIGNPGKTQASQVTAAVQQGHAQMAQLQPARIAGAPPVKTTATADKVSFDGATGTMVLSGGSPHIAQDGSDLSAAAIEFNRTTGDAMASGGVKATYAEGANGAAAVHVVADRAEMKHATDETTFSSSPGGTVRLWQGANSIVAPTLILARTRQLMTARGPAGSVKATLAESSSKGSRQPSPLRVASASLVYSGGERKAAFGGGVVAQGTAGVLHAGGLEVYLSAERSVPAPGAAGNAAANAAGASPGKTASVSAGAIAPAGQVERIVATGRVQLQQGERNCTGEELVYTADDQHFVLTGTTAAAPRVTDPVHGTVSGASLTFNNRDDSVIVSRGQSATVTDTRTPR